MNLYSLYTTYILEAIQSLIKKGDLPETLTLTRISVDPPREKNHGDLACNAAMVLAKDAGCSPHQLAQKLIPTLQAIPNVASISIAGPGFINLTLDDTIWQSHLVDILKSGPDYGRSSLGENKLVNIEYVSANPTGPMHAGHARNAVLGDVIANLLAAVGFNVFREYYINDAGNQVLELARSVYLRYREALGEPIQDTDFKDGQYPGEYLIPLGQDFARKYGARWVDQPESAWIEIFRQETMDEMLQLIKEDLSALGITMSAYTSERAISTSGLMEKVLTQLAAQGDIYEGVLNPPKGHVIEDWEPRPQTLFHATAYGDDVDRPLKKSDNTWTYFASDIAYHLDKFQRGFTEMVVVLGADHAGYLKRLTAAVQAITQNKAHLEIRVAQLVNLFENDQPVRMSKRAGTFVKLRDLVDRVGRDATRFMMVTRRHDVALDFDFAKVLEQSRDNPIFYVQYAHARTHSVLRHALALWDHLPSSYHFELLTDPAELAMMKQLAQWPKQVEVAAMTREPHRIANFLLDVAASFHSLWNKGKENAHLRFLDPLHLDLSQSRIGLVRAVNTVIGNGLRLMGITPVEEMH